MVELLILFFAMSSSFPSSRGKDNNSYKLLPGISPSCNRRIEGQRDNIENLEKPNTFKSAGPDGLPCRILNVFSTFILGLLASVSPKSQRIGKARKDSKRVNEVPISKRKTGEPWKFQTCELNINTWEDLGINRQITNWVAPERI